MKLAYKEETTEEMELAPGKTRKCQICENLSLCQLFVSSDKFRLAPVIGLLTTPGQETQASKNLVVTIEIGSKVKTTECTRGHGIIIVEDATHGFFTLQAFGRNSWGGRCEPRKSSPAFIHSLLKHSITILFLRFNPWVERDTKKNHFPQDLTNSG